MLRRHYYYADAIAAFADVKIRYYAYAAAAIAAYVTVAAIIFLYAMPYARATTHTDEISH